MKTLFEFLMHGDYHFYLFMNETNDVLQTHAEIEPKLKATSVDFTNGIEELQVRGMERHINFEDPLLDEETYEQLHNAFIDKVLPNIVNKEWEKITLMKHAADSLGCRYFSEIGYYKAFLSHLYIEQEIFMSFEKQFKHMPFRSTYLEWWNKDYALSRECLELTFNENFVDNIALSPEIQQKITQKWIDNYFYADSRHMSIEKGVNWLESIKVEEKWSNYEHKLQCYQQ